MHPINTTPALPFVEDVEYIRRSIADAREAGLTPEGVDAFTFTRFGITPADLDALTEPPADPKIAEAVAAARAAR